MSMLEKKKILTTVQPLKTTSMDYSIIQQYPPFSNSTTERLISRTKDLHVKGKHIFDHMNFHLFFQTSILFILEDALQEDTPSVTEDSSTFYSQTHPLDQ